MLFLRFSLWTPNFFCFSKHRQIFSLAQTKQNIHFKVYCNLSCQSNIIYFKHNDGFIKAKMFHWKMPQQSLIIWLHWFIHSVLIEQTMPTTFFIIKLFDNIFNILNTPVPFVFTHWKPITSFSWYIYNQFLMQTIDNDISYCSQIHRELRFYFICIEYSHVTSLLIEEYHFESMWAYNISFWNV